MTSVFNTDASLPYNHDLFESPIVKKKNKDGRGGDLLLSYYNHSEVPTLIITVEWQRVANTNKHWRRWCQRLEKAALAFQIQEAIASLASSWERLQLPSQRPGSYFLRLIRYRKRLTIQWKLQLSFLPKYANEYLSPYTSPLLKETVRDPFAEYSVELPFYKQTSFADLYSMYTEGTFESKRVWQKLVRLFQIGTAGLKPVSIGLSVHFDFCGKLNWLGFYSCCMERTSAHKQNVKSNGDDGECGTPDA
ncbi:hypothetical protein CLF_101477 [Clonorchis sinensis]|uniref:Uncharacterized protein n=1 Tax=Clonorchis sinensis TaxID=79923 RepID=G7Y5U5_CLOSI|nr:hypothetical protein CLF_101477 [Clonorchis sinensis]